MTEPLTFASSVDRRWSLKASIGQAEEPAARCHSRSVPFLGRHPFTRILTHESDTGAKLRIVLCQNCVTYSDRSRAWWLSRQREPVERLQPHGRPYTDT
jgi:hypothetical protein